MHKDGLLAWLDSQNRRELVEKHIDPFRTVFQKCLAVKDEKVLLIGDRGFFNHHLSPLVTGAYLLVALEMGLETSVILQGPKNKGDEVDQSVRDALQNLSKGSIVCVNVSNNLGRLALLTKSFRTFVRGQGHRFTSASGLGVLQTNHLPLFVSAIDVDYDEFQEQGRKIKAIFDKGSKVHVTTDIGTDFTMDITGRIAISNDGTYSTPGSGGNIPCGEVYFPPIEDRTNGRIVLDGSIRHRKGTELIKEPVVLTIVDGKVVSIEGGVEADLLRESVEWGRAHAKNPDNVNVLAEFSVAMNPNAQIIGHTLIDEKTKGTSHVAIGSNSWFGGQNKSNVHFDNVYKDPTIIVDGIALMEKGVFKI